MMHCVRWLPEPLLLLVQRRQQQQLQQQDVLRVSQRSAPLAAPQPPTWPPSLPCSAHMGVRFEVSAALV
ncbi:Synaptogenesis protein syg-1 [Frankliniella fusca]|uniref:Synaptogenesis protein syg-1 n=1 Tax=Frankliniella fusca TaxID=407009 RepID=A0AAE1HH19_9NEOP|nr:Synaptogenesis protein syg-1 [Frankliniella fusca]